MKPLEKQACNDEQEDRDEIADPKVCKPGNLSEIAKQLTVAIMLLPSAKDRLNGPTFENSWR